MPSRLHETFITRVAEEIERQLRVIAGGTDSAAHFAKDIHDARSTRLVLDTDDGEDRSTLSNKHEPEFIF